MKRHKKAAAKETFPPGPVSVTAHEHAVEAGRLGGLADTEKQAKARALNLIEARKTEAFKAAAVENGFLGGRPVGS